MKKYLMRLLRILKFVLALTIVIAILLLVTILRAVIVCCTTIKVKIEGMNNLKNARKELQEEKEKEINYALDILENCQTIHHENETIETDQLLIDDYVLDKCKENRLSIGYKKLLEELQDRIDVTTKKAELEELKQMYTEYAFSIQDIAISRNELLNAINLSLEEEREKAYNTLKK